MQGPPADRTAPGQVAGALVPGDIVGQVRARRMMPRARSIAYSSAPTGAPPHRHTPGRAGTVRNCPRSRLRCSSYSRCMLWAEAAFVPAAASSAPGRAPRRSAQGRSGWTLRRELAHLGQQPSSPSPPGSSCAARCQGPHLQSVLRRTSRRLGGGVQRQHGSGSHHFTSTSTGWSRSSSRAMSRRWTSSGPSAMRSVCSPA